MEDLKTVVFFEIVVLLIFSIFGAISALFYEFFFQKRQEKIDRLRELLTELFQQKTHGVDQYLPFSLKKLSLIVPVLEDLNKEVSGVFWQYFKYWAIHHLCNKTLNICLKARHWNNKILAIRAISLSPNLKHEERVIQFLQDKKPLVRYAAAYLAAKFETRNSIYAVLDAMRKEKSNNQYPYADPLINSSEDVFLILLEIYKTEKDPSLKLCCLKILATKTGFLNLQILQTELASKNLETKWWAICALKNSLSSKEVQQTFIQFSTDPSWQIRSLVMDMIGSLKLSNEIKILENALDDQHYWVKISAGWALKNFGEKGTNILKQKEETSQIAKYILNVPKSTIERNIKQFAALFLTSNS